MYLRKSYLLLLSHNLAITEKIIAIFDKRLRAKYNIMEVRDTEFGLYKGKGDL
jgi:hypothetical protein